MSNKNKQVHQYAPMDVSDDAPLLKKDGKRDGEIQVLELEFGFENLRTYAWVAWLTSLGVCMVISNALDLYDKEDNPIVKTYGHHNPCLWMDYFPASYVGAQFWLVTMFFFCSYATLSALEVRANYQAGRVSKCVYITFTTLYVYSFISTMLFTNIFVTHPYEETSIAGIRNADDNSYALIFHSLPYVNFGWSLCFVSCMRFWTYVYVHGISTIYKWVGFIYCIILIFLSYFKFSLEVHSLFPWIMPSTVFGYSPKNGATLWIIWIIWGSLSSTMIAPSNNYYRIPITYVYKPNSITNETSEAMLTKHPGIFWAIAVLMQIVVSFYGVTGCDSFGYEPEGWFYARYTIYIITPIAGFLLILSTYGSWFGNAFEDPINYIIPKWMFTGSGLIVMTAHTLAAIGRTKQNNIVSHLAIVACSVSQMTFCTICIVWLKRVYMTENNYFQFGTVYPYIWCCWNLCVVTWRCIGLYSGMEHQFFGYDCHSSTVGTTITVTIVFIYLVGLQIKTYRDTPKMSLDGRVKELK